MTVTSPSSNQSDTVIPGPTRGSTLPSSPTRSPGRDFAPGSISGSPLRSKSTSGPSGSSSRQSPVYENWPSTEVGGRSSKGTGTSDHPELLLPPGWEEAMADLAKEEAKEAKVGKEEGKLKGTEKELPVAVKESGSGVSRDEVETSSSSILRKNLISFTCTGWEEMCG